MVSTQYPAVPVTTYQVTPLTFDSGSTGAEYEQYFPTANKTNSYEEEQIELQTLLKNRCFKLLLKSSTEELEFERQQSEKFDLSVWICYFIVFGAKINTTDHLTSKNETSNPIINISKYNNNIRNGRDTNVQAETFYLTTITIVLPIVIVLICLIRAELKSDIKNLSKRGSILSFKKDDDNFN